MLKQSRPCADCGRAYPYWMLDWDHLRDKKFAISKTSGKMVTRVEMDEEMSKCEVVCANCHRHRTHCRKLKMTWYPIEALD
jgi:ribosomal protein S14